jgi:quercetin dioxygenase-like cupin family protein
MTSHPVPLALGPGDGDTVQGPAGGPLTFKVRGAQSGGSLLAFENVIAPGDGPPRHRHANEDEAWYVIEGDLRFELGDEIAVAAPGSFVFVPRGTPHCFQNAGDRPARILVLFTPGGMEPFFDRFAALPEADAEAFARIDADVGMEMLGPPLGRSPADRPPGDG